MQKKYVYKSRGPYREHCSNGHTILSVGRDSKGACLQCKNDWYKGHYTKRKRISKQFCKYGHDLLIVGKTKARNCTLCMKIWRSENKAKRVLYDLKKRAKRQLRVPKFGQEGIFEFCKNVPSGMTIDHVIPLCGKKVSGLHVNWNLQYLSRRDNDKKKHHVDLIAVSTEYGDILQELGLKIKTS